jgi:hypothetical protein
MLSTSPSAQNAHQRLRFDRSVGSFSKLATREADNLSFGRHVLEANGALDLVLESTKIFPLGTCPETIPSITV